MVDEALGERQGLADEAAAALAHGTPEALDVAGDSGTLAAGLVPLRRDDGGIGGPEVGADCGAVAVLRRQCLPEVAGRLLGAVAGGRRRDLPGVGVEGDPDPPLRPFIPDETPHFVGLRDHFARLFLSGPGFQGVVSRYSSSTKRCSQARDRPVTRTIPRRLIRSPSRRRTNAFRSSEIGPLAGSATKRRPHSRHRKVGLPERLGPPRMTWVAAQRGHGGMGVTSCIRLC